MKREEALEQIEIIKKVVEENKKIIPKSSSYLILWGIISIIGFLISPYLKEWNALFWIIIGLGGGLLSAYIGKKEALIIGRYTAFIGRQIASIFLIMVLSGFAITFVFASTLSNKINDLALGLLIGMGWVVLISMAWFITGIITNSSPYMIIPSVLLLLSATISAIFAPKLFYWSIAFFGGGGLFISGLLAKVKNR